MRAGKILKKGGFACGSKQLSAFLSRLLLVLFLANQEKYIDVLIRLRDGWLARDSVHYGVAAVEPVIHLSLILHATLPACSGGGSPGTRYQFIFFGK